MAQSRTCRAVIYAHARRPRRKAMLEQNCTTCGKRFGPKRSHAMHCSSACRQKAYRGRIAFKRVGSPQRRVKVSALIVS